MTNSARFALGAHVEAAGTRFGVFTAQPQAFVELLDQRGEVRSTLPLEARGDGYFELFVPDVGHGALYRFVVGGRSLPDPYARALPHGVHGPAQVYASSYAFRHPAPVRPLAQQVIYELHVGTFTQEGTFEAAQRRLPELADLGITTLELMPLGAFAGERGWGYDGVALFAPHAAYGTPDQLRELVDAAHGLGLSVLLDVVYNHFGPSGNYLGAYSADYFHPELENPWGKALRFEHAPLRELVLENARYWLEEFRFDGLRLDATHAIVDSCRPHVLAELAREVHAFSPPRVVIAEDERNLAELVTHEGLDALWADDFHHQLQVLLSSERDGYYAGYELSVAALAETINGGWLYAGQTSPTTGAPRGTSAAALPPSALVYCIQNHDQVGNRAYGERLSALVAPELYRAASLLLLFLPMTPLLFMGQEWGASSPFLYFTDHEPELGRRVSAGRRGEFAAFSQFSDPAVREQIPDPQASATFERSKLRWDERDVPEHRQLLELYRAALRLRREDEVLSEGGRHELRADTLDDALVVRRRRRGQARLFAMNFGLRPIPLAAIAERFGLKRARVVLASSAEATTQLLPGSAVILAGEA